eukprot:TRINITY_DN7477_c0_g1_i1.p1 TRINITY_DN7477_c0_g1~~TRINITY_DN7477_c0_g1_i1.p1  ORF type:complete len:371 (+),score=63.24 TRINITY_DN7477_c0_g1_i1:113-1225(+)
MDIISDKQSRKDFSIQSQSPRVTKILGFAIAAFLVSVYLVYGHYHTSSSCDITPSFSCSVVNTSTYSELFGVPVAVFGVLWNIVAIAGAWKILSGEKPLIFLFALLLWLGVGTVFVFYMIYAEFMIGVICPYCTLVHIFIGCMDYLVLKIWMGLKTKPELVHLLQIQGYIIFVVVLHLAVIFMYPSSALNFKPPAPNIEIQKIETQNSLPIPEINAAPKQEIVLDENELEVDDEENVQTLPKTEEQEENKQEENAPEEVLWDGDETTYRLALAKCLTAKGVQMFGSDYCGVCMRQKGYFGYAFSVIKYTDCSKKENARECEVRQIKSYPTWMIINEDGQVTVKMTSYAEGENLEGFSGCHQKTKKYKYIM